MSKQDRQGVRTPSDLERKYRFGETFAEFLGIANGAQKTAEKAEAAAKGLDEKLTQDEIFNRLTNNGTAKGIYRDENGEIYINASYIVAGILRSLDGESLVIDLDNGTAELTGSLTTTSDVPEEGGTRKAMVLPSGVHVVVTGDSAADMVYTTGMNHNGFRTYEYESGYDKHAILWNSGLSIASSIEPGVYILGQIDPANKLTEIEVSTDASNPLKIGSSYGANFIRGLAAPSANSEAANKAYVDGLYNKIVTALAANGITVE